MIWSLSYSFPMCSPQMVTGGPLPSVPELVEFSFIGLCSLRWFCPPHQRTGVRRIEMRSSRRGLELLVEVALRSGWESG